MAHSRPYIPLLALLALPLHACGGSEPGRSTRGDERVDGDAFQRLDGDTGNASAAGDAGDATPTGDTGAGGDTPFPGDTFLPGDSHAPGDAEPPHSISVVVDAQNPGPPVARELFGINMDWVSLGNGVVEHGDLLRDRSFRTADAWNAVEVNGDTVLFSADPGSPARTGEHAYPGYAQITHATAGTGCVVQQLMAEAEAGKTYSLDFSAYGEGGARVVSAVLVDAQFVSTEADVHYVFTAADDWSHHQIDIMPQRAGVAAVLICAGDVGTVRVDEVRVRDKSASPSIVPNAKTRIGELGLTAARWPGGIHVDTFDWELSLGPVVGRGEQVTSLGRFETVALGMHEFLDTCEEFGMTPLVQVNVLNGAQAAADLLEYIRGDAVTAQGALRSLNGRTAPWQVPVFELGNEPNGNYQGSGDYADTGRAYAALAGVVGEAMHGKAAELAISIALSGAAESTFATADWISVVPMLEQWNDQVFDPANGLLSQISYSSAHYYPYFADHTLEADRFAYLMAGGDTLKTALAIVGSSNGALPALLTEYGVIVQNGADEIQVSYLADFQSGLVQADTLLSAIEIGLPAAYAFNLSEHIGFGILRTDAEYSLRPAGHTLKLLAPLAAERRLPVSIEGATMITLPGGAGTIPSGTQYLSLVAVAAMDATGSTVRVVLLNKSYTQSEDVLIKMGAWPVSSATVYRYESSTISSHNDDSPETVSVSVTTVQNVAPLLVEVPPHSLIRVDLR